MGAKRIPIQAAKDIATKYGQSQVIIVTWDGATGNTHVVTYGATVADREQAAKGGNLVKRTLGWPESLCNAIPARSALSTAPLPVVQSDRWKKGRFLHTLQLGRFHIEVLDENYTTEEHPNGVFRWQLWIEQQSTIPSRAPTRYGLDTGKSGSLIEAQQEGMKAFAAIWDGIAKDLTA